MHNPSRGNGLFRAHTYRTGVVAKATVKSDIRSRNLGAFAPSPFLALLGHRVACFGLNKALVYPTSDNLVVVGPRIPHVPCPCPHQRQMLLRGAR